MGRRWTGDMLRSCPVCGRIHDSRIKCKSSLSQERTDAQRFRSSAAWQRKRDEIVTRDLGLCQASLREDPPRLVTDALQVHHIVKVESEWDARLDNDNLITLCGYYHELAESGAIRADVLRRWAYESEEGIPPSLAGLGGASDVDQRR